MSRSKGLGNDGGARGRTRTGTPVKASGPKPGASTNFATRAVTRLRPDGRSLGPHRGTGRRRPAAGRRNCADPFRAKRVGDDDDARRADGGRRGRRQLLDPDWCHRAQTGPGATRICRRLHQCRWQLRPVRLRAAEPGPDQRPGLDAGPVVAGSHQPGHAAPGLQTGRQATGGAGAAGAGLGCPVAPSLRRPQLLVPAPGLLHLRLPHRLPSSAPGSVVWPSRRSTATRRCGGPTWRCGRGRPRQPADS
jgi:hypothetical protein